MSFQITSELYPTISAGSQVSGPWPFTSFISFIGSSLESSSSVSIGRGSSEGSLIGSLIFSSNFSITKLRQCHLMVFAVTFQELSEFKQLRYSELEVINHKDKIFFSVSSILISCTGQLQTPHSTMR